MLIAEIIKALGSTAPEIILKLLMSKLVALLPILSFGPLNYVLSWYLQKRIKQLIDLGELGVIDFFIGSMVNAQKESLQTAMSEHKVVTKTGSPGEILASEETLKNKLRNFILTKSP